MKYIAAIILLACLRGDAQPRDRVTRETTALKDLHWWNMYVTFADSSGRFLDIDSCGALHFNSDSLRVINGFLNLVGNQNKTIHQLNNTIRELQWKLDSAEQMERPTFIRRKL